MGILTKREGDDLFVNGKKLTVSIASTSAVSQKIHFGINVSHDFYGNLEECGIAAEKTRQLLEDITGRYVKEMEDIEGDLRKSRPLDVV
jgi:hypothetical protein